VIPFLGYFLFAKILKNTAWYKVFGFFFGDVIKNVYFCRRLLIISNIIAYRNKLYSILTTEK